MTAWMIACVGLLLPLAIGVAGAARGAPGSRFVAAQLASATAVLLLAAMSFAFDQPNLIDLALCLALLNLPGMALFALMLERWL